MFRLSRTNLPSCKRHRRVVLTNWGASGRSRLRAGYTRTNFPSAQRSLKRATSPPSILPVRSSNSIRQSKPNHPGTRGFFFFLGKRVVKQSARKSKLFVAGFIADDRFRPRVGIGYEIPPNSARTEFIALLTPFDSFLDSMMKDTSLR